jgi:hypothetical protein
MISLKEKLFRIKKLLTLQWATGFIIINRVQQGPIKEIKMNTTENKIETNQKGENAAV